MSRLASRALFPSPPPQSFLSPLPVAPPSRYRLDQQLQVSGLKRVLILRIQVLKLLQEAQVIQLYIWMRGKKGKNPTQNVPAFKIPTLGQMYSKRGHRGL